MYKLFSIPGYEKSVIDEKFKGMIYTLSYGTPHGGIAQDDRIMLLAK